MPEPSPALLDRVAEDVRGGMRDHLEEWACYQANADFLHLRNHLHFERHARKEGESDRDFEERPKQYSRLTRKAIHTLTRHLYKPGPSRKASVAAVDAFLQQVYGTSHIDVLMGRLDRLATLNGHAAIQAVATGNPDRPIRLYLWGAHEYATYFADDDPMEPAVLVTKSIVPGKDRGKKRRRYEVWTDTTYEVWETKDFDRVSPIGQAAVRQAARPNSYGRIPFSFAWNELPVDRFEVEGIGQALRETNEEVDRMLSDLAWLLALYNRPEGFVRNVPQEWRYHKREGQFTVLKSLPAARDGDLAAEPDPFYLQPMVDVDAAWTHLGRVINATFRDLDVPLEFDVDMARASAESGIAIVARGSELISFTKSRQPEWTQYETAFARMLASVAANYYSSPALAADFELEVLWREPVVDVPVPERDASQQWEYSMGLLSRIDLLCQRHGLTRDQAIERLKQLAEDKELEREILGDEESQLEPGVPRGEQLGDPDDNEPEDEDE